MTFKKGRSKTELLNPVHLIMIITKTLYIFPMTTMMMDGLSCDLCQIFVQLSRSHSSQSPQLSCSRRTEKCWSSCRREWVCSLSWRRWRAARTTSSLQSHVIYSELTHPKLHAQRNSYWMPQLRVKHQSSYEITLLNLILNVHRLQIQFNWAGGKKKINYCILRQKKILSGERSIYHYIFNGLSQEPYPLAKYKIVVKHTYQKSQNTKQSTISFIYYSVSPCFDRCVFPQWTDWVNSFWARAWIFLCCAITATWTRQKPVSHIASMCHKISNAIIEQRQIGHFIVSAVCLHTGDLMINGALDVSATKVSWNIDRWVFITTKHFTFWNEG